MLDLSGRTGKYPIFRTSRQETAHQRDLRCTCSELHYLYPIILEAAMSLLDVGNSLFSWGLAAAPIVLVQMDGQKASAKAAVPAENKSHNMCQTAESAARFKYFTAFTNPGLYFLDCFTLSFIAPASLFCCLLLSVVFAYAQSSLNLPSKISKWSSNRSIRMPLKVCVLKIS